MKKKNVLIISPCQLPVPAVKGGAVLTLIESLIKRNDEYKRLNLTVVGSYDEEAEKKSKEYKNTSFIFIKENPVSRAVDDMYEVFSKKILRGKKKNRARYLWKMYVISKLKKILRNGDYDAVVFQNSGYILNVLKEQDIAEKYKGKLFYHLHNDIPDNVYKDGAKMCRFLLISDYLRLKLVKMFGEEVNQNVRILHNGFNYDMFSSELENNQRDEIRKSLDIPEGKKVVVFAGRIDETKGVEQLVMAFKKLNRDDAMLMVVGSHYFGDGRTSSFEKRMRTHFEEMKDKLRFTGFVKYEDMWKYYKLSDVAVLPSMWEEPAGLTIVEAMSAGLPVITTISGGIPEFIDERFGILLERDENIVSNIEKSINAVLDNIEEWEQKGKLASEHIKNIVDEALFYNTFCDFVEE